MNDRQKQNLLAYLGYYVGDIDGIWGAMSKTAMDAFKADYKGLDAPGIPEDAPEKALKHAVAYDMFKTEPVKDETGTFWGRIRHFTRNEFRCPCGNCGGFPVEPQEALVRAADDMREAFGCAVIIVPPDGHSGGSGVRCAAYNAKLSGSVSNSRHLFGKAIDFSAPGVSESTIEAYLSKIKSNGTIRYWYKISYGSYHMDIE